MHLKQAIGSGSTSSLQFRDTSPSKGCLSSTHVKIGAVALSSLVIMSGIGLYLLQINAFAAYALLGTGSFGLAASAIWSLIACLRGNTDPDQTQQLPLRSPLSSPPILRPKSPEPTHKPSKKSPVPLPVAQDFDTKNVVVTLEAGSGNVCVRPSQVEQLLHKYPNLETLEVKLRNATFGTTLNYEVFMDKGLHWDVEAFKECKYVFYKDKK